MATNEKATFNRLLTDKAEGLFEDNNDFFALKAFPVATVTKRLGEYPVFKIEDLYRNTLQKRAPQANYAKTNTDIEMKQYTAQEYGVEEFIADETKAEMGEGYEQSIADKLMQEGYRNYDQVVAEVAFADNAWAKTMSGVANGADGDTTFTKFTDATANVPALFKALKRKVKLACGRMPDTALMSVDVYDALMENGFVRDMIASTRDQIIDQTFLARVLGLKNIFVTETIVNTANYGKKEMANISSGKLLLYWNGDNARNSITAPCAMKIVRVNYGDINSASGLGVYTRREEAIDCDVLRVKQRFAPIIQYKEAGILLKECV